MPNVTTARSGAFLNNPILPSQSRGDIRQPDGAGRRGSLAGISIQEQQQTITLGALNEFIFSRLREIDPSFIGEAGRRLAAFNPLSSEQLHREIWATMGMLGAAGFAVGYINRVNAISNGAMVSTNVSGPLTPIVTSVEHAASHAAAQAASYLGAAAVAHPVPAVISGAILLLGASRQMSSTAKTVITASALAAVIAKYPQIDAAIVEEAKKLLLAYGQHYSGTVTNVLAHGGMTSAAVVSHQAASASVVVPVGVTSHVTASAGSVTATHAVGAALFSHGVLPVALTIGTAIAAHPVVIGVGVATGAWMLIKKFTGTN